MLRRAMVDYILYREHDNLKMRKLGEEAATWIKSESNDDSSFNHICTSMNLDPVVVRAKIGSMTIEYVRTLRGLGFDDG